MEAAFTHRALIKHDEVMKASMAARSRAISVYWLALLLAAGLVFAIEWGHLFAFWLLQQLPFEVMFVIGTSLPTVIPALFALVAVILVGSVQNWAIRRAYLKNFKRLAIPTEIEATFEILPKDCACRRTGSRSFRNGSPSTPSNGPGPAGCCRPTSSRSWFRGRALPTRKPSVPSSPPCSNG